MEVFILTGGLSRRMKRPKSEILWRGKTFREYLMMSFPEARTLGDNESFKADYPDLYQRGSSLQGIVSALTHAKEHRVLILSCDMPFVTREDLRPLLHSRGTACFFEKKYLPFPAVYEKKHVHYYKRELERGHFALQPILRRLVPSPIPLQGSSQSKMHFNTKSEFNRLRRFL